MCMAMLIGPQVGGAASGLGTALTSCRSLAELDVSCCKLNATHLAEMLPGEAVGERCHNDRRLMRIIGRFPFKNWDYIRKGLCECAYLPYDVTYLNYPTTVTPNVSRPLLAARPQVCVRVLPCVT